MADAVGNCFVLCWFGQLVKSECPYVTVKTLVTVYTRYADIRLTLFARCYVCTGTLRGCDSIVHYMHDSLHNSLNRDRLS